MKSAGILMPISSLPSPYGIGTFGRAAYRFVDFLKGAGCKIWQVLPLQPTSFGDSPYQSNGAQALNPYFIDLDFLARDGLLLKEEYAGLDWGSDPRRVDYGKLYAHRIPVLRKAFARFDRSDPRFLLFLREERYREYAIFMALKDRHGGASFETWGDFSKYDRDAVDEFARTHGEEILFYQFTQFQFLVQWRRLKKYANDRGIEIMGDIPFYVAWDSVETWKYGDALFLLEDDGSPAALAGVPPDAFSATGQLWGNPVYDWEKMKEDEYSWWRRRIEHGLKLYDILRIDHFIGFARYYCIPADRNDARCGEWRRGPGAEVFRGYENSKIVAEDLGVVTDEVRAVVAETGYPGMKILQHAFDGDPHNEHKPSNYRANTVAYTGTHDNETLMSRISGMRDEERDRMLSDLRTECVRAGVPVRGKSDKAICRTIMRLLYASRANTVILPMQDILFMGEEGRMNLPSVVSEGNWSLRFLGKELSSAVQKSLFGLAAESGRK